MNNQKNLYIVILIICAIVGLYLVIPKVQQAVVSYADVKAKTLIVETTKQQITELKAKQEEYEKEEKVSTKPVYQNEIATSDLLSSFGVMFEDVIQSAKYNGLKLRSISYNTSPNEDVVQKNIQQEYNVCAISMQLIGNYMQFRSYFQDVYNYPYLINLDKISIKPYESNKRLLVADIAIVLYSKKVDGQQLAAPAPIEGDQAAAPTTVQNAPMPGM